MKKILILAVAIVMCASLASAQSGGHIGIYSDVAYTDCNVNTIQGLTPVYVVHTLLPQANSSQFKVLSTGVTATLLSVSVGSNILIGSTPANSIFEGAAITYVGCKPLPHLLATISYFTTGFETPCSSLEVVPDPAVASGDITAVDCALAVLAATGGKFTFNGNETCPCVQEVSTEETNWSRIKALYQ